MNKKRQQKLIIILSCLIVAGAGVGFILFSLSQSINLFRTPTQVTQGDYTTGTIIRVGGLVVEQSVQRGKNTQVSFDVTDTSHAISVLYDGILPDLFQEGQAVVVKGQVGDNGILVASEVLAKHDENYMPPEAAEALMQAMQAQQTSQLLAQ